MFYILLVGTTRHIGIDCVFAQLSRYVYRTGDIRRRPSPTYAGAIVDGYHHVGTRVGSHALELIT
jgi:hypothetical protein